MHLLYERHVEVIISNWRIQGLEGERTGLQVYQLMNSPFGYLFRAWGFKGEGESYHWTIRKSFCRMNLELSLREGSRFLKAGMEQGMASGSTAEGRCLATSGESVTMGMSPVHWTAFHCLRLWQKLIICVKELWVWALRLTMWFAYGEGVISLGTHS